MALKIKGVYKTVSGNTQFALTPNDGESILVQGIYIDTPSSNFATIKIAQTTVGYWPVAGTNGNTLHYPLSDDQKNNLYDRLLETKKFRPYPIGQGETLNITGVHQSTSNVTLKYDIYDERDILNTHPNGSQAKELDFINLGSYSTTLAAGENLYATQVNTTEFPAFPWTGQVPQNREYIIHGYLFSDMSKATITPISTQQTKFVRFQLDQTSLFDEDLNGFIHEGGTYVSNGETIGTGLSMGGFYSSVDMRPFINFEPALKVNAGSELKIYVKTELDSGAVNIAANDAYLGLITTLIKK